MSGSMDVQTLLSVVNADPELVSPLESFPYAGNRDSTR